MAEPGSKQPRKVAAAMVAAYHEARSADLLLEHVRELLERYDAGELGAPRRRDALPECLVPVTGRVLGASCVPWRPPIRRGA